MLVFKSRLAYSQGSVATHLRHGGIFNDCKFPAEFVSDFLENPSIFDKVKTLTQWLTFWTTLQYTYIV